MQNQIKIHPSFFQEINHSRHVLLSKNQSWNGDSAGALFAFANYLLQKKKNVSIFINESIPESLQYFINSEISGKILFSPEINDQHSEGADLIITLGSLPESSKDFFANPEISHLFIAYNAMFEVTENFLVTFPTTLSEMVYEIFDQDKVEINEAVALQLYSGIVFGSSSFRARKTRSETHKIAAKLLERLSVNTNEVYQQLFEKKSLSHLQLYKQIAKTSELLFNNQVVISFCNDDMMKSSKASQADLYDLMEYPFVSRQIRISVLLYPVEKTTRVYLISKSPYTAKEILSPWYPTGDNSRAEGIMPMQLKEADKEIKEVIGATINKNME